MSDAAPKMPDEPAQSDHEQTELERCEEHLHRMLYAAAYLLGTTWHAKSDGTFVPVHVDAIKKLREAMKPQSEDPAE